jgi:hypothetical protein
MTQNNDEQIRLDFALRRRRQLIAMVATFILLLLLALVSRRPDIFGVYARNDILAAQVLLVGGFIWFHMFNWRCPSCKKSIGPDINRSICKQCGARLR